MPIEQRDHYYLDLALDLALRAARRGHVPIASVIVDDRGLLGLAVNQRVAKSSMVLHAETAAIEDAGRENANALRGATLYSTLSPCHMCTGAIVHFRIQRVVVADRTTFEGPTHLLREAGVEVYFADCRRAAALMSDFIREQPLLWDEDNASR